MPVYSPEPLNPYPLDFLAQSTLDMWEKHGYPKIFINYRNGREDTEESYYGDVWASVILDEYLSGWFGVDAIFRATRSVPRCPGYGTLLRKAVAECRIFLPVIGVGWEQSLEHHPWVVEEFRLAIEAGKTILPVILRQETPPPLVNAAGENLDPLVSHMPGLPLGSRHTRQDVYEIAREIVSHAPDIQLPRPSQTPGPGLRVLFSR